MSNTGKAEKEWQSQLISTLSAHGLATHTFHHHNWCMNADESTAHADELKDTVRVYYLSKYIQPTQLAKLLTHVPYICTGGDAYIVTQDGKQYGSLSKARESHPYLITPEERRISRNKCVASLAKVFASGGYRTELKSLPKDEVFDCVVVSGAGPQFEAEYLDYNDFIVTNEGLPSRLDAYAHFGNVKPLDESAWKKAYAQPTSDFAIIKCPGKMLHVRGYKTSMEECIYLWLHAFDSVVREHGLGKQGYFKMAAIGTGFFAQLAGTYKNIGYQIMPLLMDAVEAVLADRTFPSIAAIEFPDFSREGLFTPRRKAINGIRLVAAPMKDVLDFSVGDKESYIVGLLNPGDCFACVGNELEYGSVEAMIGNNTTIRLTQCYIWNEKLLSEKNWVAVDY